MEDSDHAVFISHHAANADAAQALASMLRAAGTPVRCDAPSSGTDNPHARLAAMMQSAVIVVWLSTEHCLDARLQREFMQVLAASTRHPPKERVVLIDALSIHSQHAKDASLPTALRTSCQVVRPNQLSEYIEMLAARAKRLRVPLGATPKADSEPRRDFAARIGHLWQIHEALAQPNSSAPRAVQLVGDGGAGKTWLANEYARLLHAAYPGGVFRIDAGWLDEPSTAQLNAMRALAWREIAATLGLDRELADEFELAAELKRRLEQRHAAYLWVVDHVPAGLSPDDVRAWFAPSALGATIVITRSAEYGGIAPTIAVGALDYDEARALLALHKPMMTPQEAASGRQLIEHLGAHALALQLAAQRLARSTYDRMLLQLAAPPREAAQLADGLAATLPHPQLVGIAVSIHRSIARLGTQARLALRLASVLAPAPVPTALLATALTQSMRSASTQASVSQTQHAIDELLGYSLAHAVGGEALALPPLIREAVLCSETANDLDAARNLLVATLAGELQQATDVARTNPYWPWVPHVLHVTRTATSSPQLVEINAWLARFDSMLGALRSGNRRAVALLERGDIAAAQQVLDMELAARRAGLGEDHPYTVTPVNNLGVALSLRGEFARARTLFERAIELRRRALGDSHIDLLTPLNNLGVVLWHEGEHAKARKLFEKVVELRKHFLGDRHPDTLVSMRNLAVALRHDGEYVAARSLLEHVVEVRRASLGQQHVDTCTAMASLAETLREHSDAILSRISDTLKLDTPLLGHDGVRIARA